MHEGKCDFRSLGLMVSWKPELPALQEKKGHHLNNVCVFLCVVLTLGLDVQTMLSATNRDVADGLQYYSCVVRIVIVYCLSFHMKCFSWSLQIHMYSKGTATHQPFHLVLQCMCVYFF